MKNLINFEEPANTIEEFIESSDKNPVMTKKLVMNICRRIKKLEVRNEKN